MLQCGILTSIVGSGSRYICDLYYEKEAIDKKLYDWLLKNGYADANLIAKWKKQGYEKVGSLLRHHLVGDVVVLIMNSSYVAYVAFRPRRRTSIAHVSAVCHASS